MSTGYVDVLWFSSPGVGMNKVSIAHTKQGYLESSEKDRLQNENLENGISVVYAIKPCIGDAHFLSFVSDIWEWWLHCRR